jgi:fucose 4-O-acetylase-like acetyltransferase
VLALLAMIGLSPERSIFVPLRWLGQCALLIYILHLVIIAYILGQSKDKNLLTFVAINFCTVAVLVAIAAGVRQFKTKVPSRPYIIRFLLGG